MKAATKALLIAILPFVMIGCSGNPGPSGSGGSGGTGGTGGSGSTFTIGGSVTGLSGGGLVLQDNGGNNLSVATSGSFTFSTAIASGKTYAVTVLTQPTNPAQTCTVTNGSGTATAVVTNIQVACGTGTVTIGGSVTGLQGSGLVLQDNGGANLTVNTSGTFVFGTALTIGATYNVTVLTQPSNPAQVCTVASGSGTASQNIGTVIVTCSTGTLSLGGSVSGLDGTGMVLQDNAGTTLNITANGSFTFATLIPSGAYSVTIATQPSNPTQSCTVTNGSGTTTTNVTSVQIICPAVFFPVGGQVIGLLGNGGGMVAQNNGGDNLPLTGNGPFQFVTPIAYGGQYDVSLFVGPSTQPQGCVVWDFEGQVLAPVTTVSIDCGHNDWSWFDGSNTANQDGTATAPPTPPVTSFDTASPGGRKYPATWVDSTGQLWLFGGIGYDVTSGLPFQDLNDMWVYQGTQNYSGSFNNFWQQTGTNGATGAPAPRWGAVTWTSNGGTTLWLFGGQVGTTFLSDLWRFDVTSHNTGTWTFVSGSANTNGTYGTPGSYGAGNIPGSRWGATARTDSSGNLWLFGGFGYDASSSSPGLLNDLWEFNGTQWRFVSGSQTENQDGVYGTQGSSTSTTVPGGRQASVSWMDSSNNFWVFGGYDLSSGGQPDAFNDLWEYSATTQQWTWVAGSSGVNQPANYGVQGTAAASNVPGARWASAAWIDSAGHFFLFGGEGFDATADGTLGDMWEFNGTQWVWLKGPSSVSQPGTYGLAPSEVIYPHSVNYPGTRWAPGYWYVPSTGEFWMFGGEGYDSTTTSGGIGLLNDLWRYLPFP